MKSVINILAAFGRIFFILWLAFIGVTTAYSMYQVLTGKASVSTAVIYSSLGGFLVGSVLTFFMARLAQKKALREATDTINGRIVNAMTRIQPLRNKFNLEVQGFMAAIMEGDQEKAERHKKEAERLTALIDVVAEEQLGMVSDDDRKDGD